MAKSVVSENAPRPVGPYSQAIVTNGFVFCSGQIGIDPAIGKLVPGGSADEARQCLRNLSHVLATAGLSFKDVVRTTVFVTDLSGFKEINEAYGSFLSEPFPARTTVQVAALPLGAKVEIDAIAEMRGH
ncbi:MAG: RidA family protein [Methanomassiliicoccales archaeon]|nr:RidA family protein [Methanomassiliicoccales archaeon]